MCLVFMLVAWRLKLPVVGVGLPGHFLARFQNSSEEIYIDAFYRGRFLTKNDCIHHLVRGNFPLDETHFSPATPHRILMRICANLYQSYQNLPPLAGLCTMEEAVKPGLPLEECVRRATSNPAKIMGYEGTVGTLKPGANADVALFELRDGNFELRDSDNDTITAKRRLLAQMTIKDGTVRYERPAGT